MSVPPSGPYIAQVYNASDPDVKVSDMQAALTAKQDVLVSGTNLKTINSTTLLGSGNIVISSYSLPSMTGNSGKWLTNNGTSESWGTIYYPTAGGATTEILVGGGTSSNAVWTTATGSGAPVRAVSPTFTGTITAAGATFSSTVQSLSSNAWSLSTAGAVVFRLLTAQQSDGTPKIFVDVAAGNVHIAMSSDIVQKWYTATTGFSTVGTTISQQSAGVIQIGTTAANALGSLVCATVTAGLAATPGTFAVVNATTATATLGLRRITDRSNRLAYPDGTNWRFVSDDAIIS